MTRWQLRYLSTDEIYVFEMNPQTMKSPHGPKAMVVGASTLWDRQRTRQQHASPYQWEFGGVVRTKTQYDAFMRAWFRGELVEVTDHLDRSVIAKFVAVDMVRAGRRQAPWRHTYTVQALVFPDLAP